MSHYNTLPPRLQMLAKPINADSGTLRPLPFCTAVDALDIGWLLRFGHGGYAGAHVHGAALDVELFFSKIVFVALPVYIFAARQQIEGKRNVVPDILVSTTNHDRDKVRKS